MKNSEELTKETWQPSIATTFLTYLYGRYEFRKQPEPVDVDEIVRELPEIQIGNRDRFGGVILN
jgi:hypothetical protein